jgi:hypothetical protein
MPAIDVADGTSKSKRRLEAIEISVFEATEDVAFFG